VWSVRRLYAEILRITEAVEKRIVTRAVQFRAVNCERVIEDEITRRLNSDLKCQFVLRSVTRRRLVKTETAACAGWTESMLNSDSVVMECN
jgi:hypothetical protein